MLAENKYENVPNIRFPHEDAIIFVTSRHFSEMRALWASGHLVKSGYFSDKR